jgi:hypothetical protein
LSKCLNISAATISSFSQKLFNVSSIKNHDARYDCAATYLCYKKALEQGIITGL